MTQNHTDLSTLSTTATRSLKLGAAAVACLVLSTGCAFSWRIGAEEPEETAPTQQLGTAQQEQEPGSEQREPSSEQHEPSSDEQRPEQIEEPGLLQADAKAKVGGLVGELKVGD